MRIHKLLSFRLFVLVSFMLTALTFIVSYYQLESQTKNYAMILTECGIRVSNLIKGSTRNSMMIDHKEETYRIIRSLAKQRGIEKIRIYNKRGTIIFSADDAEINKTVDMKNEACFMCHKESGSAIEEPQTNERRRIFTRADGSRALGFVTPIKNERACYTSDCHVHSESEPILGTLDIIISLEEMDKIIIGERSRMITTSILITLLMAMSVGVFIWFFVHNPVKKIIIGTKEISSGNLDHQITISSHDEIGGLARSFNQMTDDLKKAKAEITDWSEKLERRVKQKATELENTQKRNLQIEKMASLGQLSATVAHELNNPMAGILTYSKLIQKKINNHILSEEERQSILKYLKMIENESARSGKIVQNMLLFSRQNDIEIVPADINEIVDSSVDLIAHHLKIHNINLRKEYQKDLPKAAVDENQIKQALLALFVNSVEAMEQNGTLTVGTRLAESNDEVIITVSDNGRGIPEEVKSLIFEPFFTTKNAVKQVGLGLSSVYAIINKHNGEISVDSELGKGTTFTIRLLLRNDRRSKS